MVCVGFFGAIIYGVSMLMFAILRQKILITNGGGLTLSLIWNLMGPLCTGAVEFAMIFRYNNGGVDVGDLKFNTLIYFFFVLA